MSLGKVSIAIEAQMAGFESDMGRAARIAEKEFKKMGQHAQRAESEMTIFAKRAGMVLGTAIAAGATAAAASLFALTKNAIDNADKMDEMSQKLGVSTEQLSKWGYAAKLSGTDIDGLARSFGIFSKNVLTALDGESDMGQVFDALGVSATDAEGKLRTVESLLPDIADKFKELDDQTLETALAMKLFGKSGADMMEFLNRGSVGIADLGRELESLNGVIDGRTAKAAAEFNNNLDKLKVRAGALGMEIAQELLPDLISLTGELVDVDSKSMDVSSAAKDMAESIREAGAAIRDLGGLASGAIKFLEGLRGVLVGVELQGNAAFNTLNPSNWSPSGFKKLAEQYSQGTKIAEDALAGKGYTPPAQEGTGAPPRTSAGRSRRGGAAMNMTPGVSSNATAEALRAIFEEGSASPRGGGKAKAGPSDAEREADALLSKYESLAASQREQIALFGQTGEAAQIRYDVENGELAALSEIQKQELITGAERLDMMREEEEVASRLADESKRQEAAFKETNAQILEQIELIGMSAAEQEIWNNLAWAGVDAESAKGKEIIANTRLLQQQRDSMDDQIGAMDAVRDAGAGFITDLATGSKSFKDAMLDALDSIHARITQMIAEKLMDQLFGMQGDPGGGSAGGWLGSVFGSLFGGTGAVQTGAGSMGGNSGGGIDWAGLIGSFFGGGRAMGGPVSGGSFYEVGENNRPEMFRSGGKSYLIPGNDGAVAPMGSGGGTVQNNTFQFAAPTSMKTQSQLAARLSYEQGRARRFSA